MDSEYGSLLYSLVNLPKMEDMIGHIINVPTKQSHKLISY